MEFDIDNYHLKSLSLLDLVSPKEATLLKSRMVRREFLKGAFLFRENSYSKGIYVVRKGKVKIFQTGEDGKRSIVYFYRKGDFFGHRPILAKEPHPVSAMAMDQVVVSFIPMQTFLSVLDASDTLARQLLVNLSKEFSVWINKMTLFTRYNLKKRVALSLLILCRVYQRAGSDKATISITRDDFASYVGTAKETLVRMLRQFKDEEIIVANGTNITITDMKALQKIVYSAS